MATKAESDQPKGKRRLGSTMTWVIGAAVTFAFYGSIILLLVGMVPTIVAFITDPTPQKDRARTVAYLNFAGCVPWAVEYWLGGGDLDRVFEMVGDPYVLLVMYSAAAVGWLLYFGVRPVVASYLVVASQIKETQLKKRQDDLLEEWGESVRKDALASGLVEAPQQDQAAADDAAAGVPDSPRPTA